MTKYRLQGLMIAAEGNRIRTRVVNKDGAPQLRTFIEGGRANVVGYSRFNGWISIDRVIPRGPGVNDLFWQALEDAINEQPNLQMEE